MEELINTNTEVNGMNELLKVNYYSERITLSAKELHEFLEIKSNFTTWFKRMAEYGFIENVDYRAIFQKWKTVQGNETVSTDYEITLDMAKEIAMLQRSEKGKQCRQYFLELERKWNSPEAVMNRALEYSRRQVKALMEENTTQKKQIAELKPKALFTDAVSASKGSVTIGALAKMLTRNGVTIGQNRLYAWLRENGYVVKDGRNKNVATQRYVEQGLFELKENLTFDENGEPVIRKPTTMVTGKGQKYFIDKFLKGLKF